MSLEVDASPEPLALSPARDQGAGSRSAGCCGFAEAADSILKDCLVETHSSACLLYDSLELHISVAAELDMRRKGYFL